MLLIINPREGSSIPGLPFPGFWLSLCQPTLGSLQAQLFVFYGVPGDVKVRKGRGWVPVAIATNNAASGYFVPGGIGFFLLREGEWSKLSRVS